MVDVSVIIALVAIAAVATVGFVLGIVATVQECSCPEVSVAPVNPAAPVDETVTPVVFLSDGSASEPSLAFLNSEETGIYLRDGNSLAVTVDGTRMLTVSPSGVEADAFRMAASEPQASASEATLFSSSSNQCSLLGSDGVARTLTDQDFGSKRSVRAATTADGALSTAFAAGQAVDGVTLATGDRILIKDQAGTAENGVYTVNASGAPTRASDFSNPALFALGTSVLVQEGTTNERTTYFTSTKPATIGTDSWQWTATASGGATTLGQLNDASTTGTPVNPIALALNFTTGSFSFGDTDASLTSSNCVFIGKNAGGTNGNGNVAIGFDALTAVTGAGNVGIGQAAGGSITSGTFNTIMGFGSGGSGMTTAGSNTCIGNQCRAGADSNVCVGDLCGSSSLGERNVGIGELALSLCGATDTHNVAIGVEALSDATGGANVNNVAIGRDAMKGSASTAGVTGSVAIGQNALTAVTTGINNVAVGTNAMLNGTTGAANACFGPSAGLNITTGSDNSFFGDSAGINLTTGDNNIAIGNLSRVGSASSSNVTIGDNAGSANQGNSNVTIGDGAANALGANCSFNVSLGFNSMSSISGATNSNNIAIGQIAMAGSGSTTGSSDNVAIGRSTLQAITTGDSNVAVGLNALQALTTGSNNVSIGNDSAAEITTGSLNVCVGDNTKCGVATNGCVSVGDTAGSATSGNNTICIGANAGDATIATSNTNIAIGLNAFGAASGGTNTNNVCIGQLALAGSGSTAGATDNVAIGRTALQALTGGDDNVAIGFAAGLAGTTATNNVFIGNNSASAVTTGNNNVAVGRDTRIGPTSNECIVIGIVSGSATMGHNNIVMGTSTGGALTASGTHNVLIGPNSNTAITTGSNNVGIGSSSSIGSTVDNAVALGTGISATQNGSFNVIHRTIAAGTNASFTGNELHADTSSKRYKRDITDYLPDAKQFMQLRPVNYRAKKGHSGDDTNPKELDKLHAGFIAEEVNEIFPEFVTFSDRDHAVPESVQYGQMVALLTKVVQMQQKRIDEQDKRIAALEEEK